MSRKYLARWMQYAGLMAAVVAGGCAPQHQTTYEQANVPAMKETLVYLASSEQEGRGVGSAGLDRAADYIADRFRLLGLRPGNGGSYFQNFPMTVAATIDPGTSLRIGGWAFEVNKDYLPLNFSAEKSFSGSAVFVGYGISSTKYAYDDYAGMDVKGKVAVALRYEPHDEKGKSRFTHGDFSGEASLYAKAKAAAAHGAAGLLIVNPPTYHEGDTLFPFTHSIMERQTSVPVMHVKQSVGESLLGNLKEIQKKLDVGGKPMSRELAGVSISGEVKIHHERKPVKNVMAVLAGSGPHRNEYVVVGSHYDHLGRGGLVPGAAGKNVIYFGADDNASGTTAMMELARREARKGPRDRSILFVAFTAEEEGLIGSVQFIEKPPVPLEKIAYMVNLDMVGRLKDETLFVGGEGTAKDLEPILKEADKGMGLQFKSIGKGGYGPSDHQSFAMKKIPVLFLFTGLHADYHRPTDTWDKINFTGMEEIAEFGQRVIDSLDTAPREAYVSAFDSQGISLGGAGGGNGATLGVIPDYVEDNSVSGVKISGTMPDSPAAAAGLQAGDVVVQFGATKITNLYELSDALHAAKPGDKIAVKFIRGKETREATAVLAQRKG